MIQIEDVPAGLPVICPITRQQELLFPISTLADTHAGLAPLTALLPRPSPSPSLHGGPERTSRVPAQLTEKSPVSRTRESRIYFTWTSMILSHAEHESLVRQVPVTAELCAFVHREQGESPGGL